MYAIRDISSPKLVYGMAVAAVVGVGVSIPLFAVNFQQGKRWWFEEEEEEEEDDSSEREMDLFSTHPARKRACTSNTVNVVLAGVCNNVPWQS
jgi:hypothetical protein